MAGRGRGIRSPERTAKIMKKLYERPRGALGPLKEAVEAVTILEKFFLPLVFSADVEGEIRIEEKLEMLFGTKYRDVLLYTVTKKFRMPGNEVRHNSKLAKTSFTRTTKPGSLLIVREDQREPTHVDLGVYEDLTGSAGRFERWFRLTAREFEEIKRYLRLASVEEGMSTSNGEGT